jgi:hypothetical protein
MALPYKNPANYRGAPSRVPTPEAISISGGLALLSEAPADPAAYAVTVVVNGGARTRVLTTPAAGQYRIQSQTIIKANGQATTEWLPLLEFHSSDEGLTGTVDYYRVGTVLTAEWVESMMWLLSPITGVASISALQSTYPATSVMTAPGRPGRVAFLTDDSMYYSNGSQWKVVAANVDSNTWAHAFTMGGGFAFAATRNFTAAWTALEGVAAGLGYTTASSYIASGIAVSQALGLGCNVTFTGGYSGISITYPGDGATVSSPVTFTGTSAAGATVELWDTRATAITSPAAGATVSSPVTFEGTAESGTVIELWDTEGVAPTVVAFSVQDTTGTAMTGIEGEATDSIGIVGWIIKEQAADSGWTAPAAGDAGWNTIASTTTFHSHALTFTSSASATGTRYFKLWVKDGAGNVSAGSATSSCTITISAAVTRSDNFDALTGYTAYSGAEAITTGMIRAYSNHLFCATATTAGGNAPNGASGSFYWCGYMGTNWASMGPTGSGRPSPGAQVNQSTGRVGSQVANATSYWSADTFNANQFSQITPTAFYTGTTRGVAPAVRCSTAGADTCYFVLGTTTYVALYKYVAGTMIGGSFLTTAARTMTAGDVIRLEASGTGASVDLTVKVNGSTVLTYSDTASDRIVSGQVGIRVIAANQTAYEAESWSGGEV